MRILKKSAFAVLVVCVFVMFTVFCAANVSAAGVVDSGECGDNLTWVLYDDGELVIEGTGDMWNWNGWENRSPWYDNRGKITSVTFGEGVTSIGQDAFYDCDGITSITIPEGIVIIGNYAFDDCDSLTSVTIPESATIMGWGSFCRCHNLANITVDPKNPVFYTDESGVLLDRENSRLVQYPIGSKNTEYTVPDGIVKIELHAFEHAKSLTNVVLPDSVTTIEMSAFFACTGLTSINIPNSVTMIDSSAFYTCSGITSVTIPQNVSLIGGDAFGNCINLTSVTVLSKDVEFNDSSVFNGAHTDLTLYGYRGSTTEAYAAANGHKFVPLDGEPTPEYLLGDINRDDSVDIADAILLFQHSMLPEMYPIDYPCSVDFNRDGSVDISDAILLFQHSMLPDMYPIA